MHLPTRSVSILFIFGALFAIFFLPTLIPLQPTASVSYLFGYDNRTGIVLLVLFATLGALWKRGSKFPFLPSVEPPRASRRPLWIALAVVSAGCIVMIPLAGATGGFGESGYEINRILLLVHGQKPYVDFEWIYGVSLLYGPVLFMKIFSLGLLSSYYLFWVLNCLAGTWILFEVIQRIDYPTQSRTTIFWIIFSGSYISSVLSMGTHSSYLRFNLPLLCVLLVYRIAQGSTIYAQLRAAAIAIVFVALLITISPEMAIAYAFAALCAILLASRSTGRTPWGLLSFYCAACVAAFWIALRLRVLGTLLDYANGASSLPIAPAPHFFLFFGAVFLCACAVVHGIRNPKLAKNTLLLIAFAFPMLASALGRADPFHVFLSGEGIFIPCLFYLSNLKRPWKWLSTAFVTFLIVVPGVTYLRYYLPSVAHAGLILYGTTDDSTFFGRSLKLMGQKYIASQSSPAKRAKWEAHLAHAREDAVPATIDFTALYPNWRGDFDAPFGYAPNSMGTYYSNRIHFDRYDGVTNAYTPRAIQEQIQSFAKEPGHALLVPDYYRMYCTTDAQDTRSFLSLLYAFPYLGRVRNTQNIYSPLCDHIESHYTLVQPPEMRNFNYGLWVIKKP